MSALGVVLIVVAAIVVVLFLLGLAGAQRRREAGAETFRARLAEANAALAAASAEDRGWDLTALEAAARAAAESRSPGATIRAVHLVQVVDRPGTDEDEARFHVDVARARDFEVVLHRSGDTWSALEPR